MYFIFPFIYYTFISGFPWDTTRERKTRAARYRRAQPLEGITRRAPVRRIYRSALTSVPLQPPPPPTPSPYRPSVFRINAVYYVIIPSQQRCGFLFDSTRPLPPSTPTLLFLPSLSLIPCLRRRYSIWRCAAAEYQSSWFSSERRGGESEKRFRRHHQGLHFTELYNNIYIY